MKSEILHMVIQSGTASSYEKILLNVIQHSDFLDIPCMRINSVDEITDARRIKFIESEVTKIIHDFFNGNDIKIAKIVKISGPSLVYLVQIDGWPEAKTNVNNPYAFFDKMHLTKMTHASKRIMSRVEKRPKNNLLQASVSTV